MSKIDYQALREVAEAIKVVATPQKLLAFRMKVTPQVVLALLDELDKWQQESSAWQAVAEKQLALAADAEKRIAELESLTAPRLPQPAPVSVPEVVGWEDVPEEITEDDIALASAWAIGFNQCRAAMLQDSEPATDNTNQQFESLAKSK